MVTVIIPVYNVEPYLRQCLDSVVAQTCRALEIILVDDGSPDRCGEICEEYAAKDARVRVLHQENQGLSGARNAGLDAATGEYVLFVDSDDWIDSQLIEKCITRAEATGADIVQFGCVYVHDDGAREPFALSIVAWDELRFDSGRRIAAPARLDYYYQYQLSGNVYNAWLRLIRRSLIEKFRLRFVDTAEIIYEDVLFGNCLWAVARSAAFLREHLYYYRLREGSLTGTGSSVSPARVEGVLQNALRFGIYCTIANACYAPVPPAIPHEIVPVTAFVMAVHEYTRARLRLQNEPAAREIARAIYAADEKRLFRQAALGAGLRHYGKARGYGFVQRLALRALALSFALGGPERLLERVGR